MHQLLLLLSHSTKISIGQDKAQSTANDRREFACAVSRSFYPHDASSSSSWSVEPFIQDVTMDIARSAPQRAHYDAKAIYMSA